MKNNYLADFYSNGLFHVYNRTNNKELLIKESHFTEAIVYIHTNPLKHKLCSDFTTYPWSSWHTMISDFPTQLYRDEVLDWFGGLQPFIDAHKILSKYNYSNEFRIEENEIMNVGNR